MSRYNQPHETPECERQVPQASERSHISTGPPPSKKVKPQQARAAARPSFAGEENVNAYYLEYDDKRSGGFAPLDRLYLSPQCGFASCEIGNKLTEEEQWAKLKLVKEIVGEVWPDR